MHPPVPFHIPTLSRCSHCRKLEVEIKGKLKRCAACSATMYCSKECQKAAWPQHKIKCQAQWIDTESDPRAGNITLHSRRPAPNEPPPPGSVATLAAAMDAWVEIHTYALSLLATATVCLEGGFSLNLSSDAPRILMFHIDPLPTLAASLLSHTSDDNPAEGFKIVDLNVITRAQIESVNPPQPGRVGVYNWELTQDACRTMEATLRERAGQVPDPTLVGAMSALYGIKHSPLLRHQPIAISRLPPNRADTLDPALRPVFEDIRTLCVRSINAGLVFQPPSLYPGRGPPWPDVGILVRQRKKDWVWEPIRNWDWGRVVASNVLMPWQMLKADMHPKELWKLFFCG